MGPAHPGGAPDEDLPIDAQTMAAALLEGAGLGNYSFNHYKEKPKQQALKTISLLVPPAAVKKFAPLVAAAEAVCQATWTARQWVSMPSNDKSPPKLASLIAQALKNSGIKVSTLE